MKNTLGENYKILLDFKKETRMNLGYINALWMGSLRIIVLSKMINPNKYASQNFPRCSAVAGNTQVLSISQNELEQSNLKQFQK